MNCLWTLVAFQGKWEFSFDTYMDWVRVKWKKYNNKWCCAIFNFRQSDIEILSKFILDHEVPLNLRITKIAYKLLNLLDFQSNDDDGMQRLLKFCFDTLNHIHDTSNSSTNTPDSNESIQHVILLMRICSNIVARNQILGGFIIANWFQSQNRSMTSFFNHFIDLLLTTNGSSVPEIYWFIGNLLKCPTNESTIKYLEREDFLKKLNTNYLSWK